MMKRFFKFIPTCVVFFLLQTSCSPEKQPMPELAFYHWKSTFNLSSVEENVLAQNEISQLFIRVFDVDWQNAPVPVGVIQENSKWPNQFFIPTIFITNRTFENMESGTERALAEKVIKKITALIPPQKMEWVKGLQIDCDWTESTRAIYFSFLTVLQDLLPSPLNQQISATIRLHQIKYFERTGVPPVDRGMLMYYNMSKVMDPATQNSILDLEIAQQYLVNFDRYPLALDIALPVYSWGVLIREGKVIRLINNLLPKDLVDSTRFKKIEPPFYEVKKSTYLEGYYLYEGDQIRLELITPDELEGAVQQLRDHLPVASRTMAFYHLDSVVINRYPKDLYRELQTHFTQ